MTHDAENLRREMRDIIPIISTLTVYFCFHLLCDYLGQSLTWLLLGQDCGLSLKSSFSFSTCLPPTTIVSIVDVTVGKLRRADVTQALMWPECSHGNPFPSHTAPTEPDKHHLPLQRLLLGSNRLLSWGLLKFTDCHSLCWLSFLRNSRGIVGSRNAGHQWLPSHVLGGPFITSFKGETARLCQETKKDLVYNYITILFWRKYNHRVTLHKYLILWKTIIELL